MSQPESKSDGVTAPSAGSERAMAESRDVLGSAAVSSSATGSGSGKASEVPPTGNTPSSFFSSSLSATDSAFHRVAVLLCPGCTYLEFPGCLMHSGLLCNIKGNGYMSCLACELDRKAKGGADVPGGADNMLSMVCATDSAEPWSVACQHCNKVKADTLPWILADSESVAISKAVQEEKEDVIPTTIIQCEQCKTSQFALLEGRLTRRDPSDPSRGAFLPPMLGGDAGASAPASMTLADFPFKHYVSDCQGALIPIPILISKLEGKFCGQALPESPYLPLDSSFVPGFIPPLEWVTGQAHRARLRTEEHRRDKYVLAGSIGHRTPVWRDRAFIGVFGDPFVRDTELEGGHIAESIDAMHFVLQCLYRSSEQADGNDGHSALGSDPASSQQDPLPFSFSTASWLSTFPGTRARQALKSVIDTLKSSMAPIHQAKDALDALQDKDLLEGEKQQFNYRLIRNTRRRVRDMRAGEVLLLPGGWIGAKAGHAIMHILYRHATSFSLVTCNTGGGLTFHPSTVSSDGGKYLFRTSIRLDDIPPERMLDDAFWILFWRLQTVQSDDHDHHTLYEVLLPSLAQRPLAEAIAPLDPHAEWRTPQRAGNCYLKCVLECIRYLLRSFGMDKPQTKQCSFAVRRLWMNLVRVDLEAHGREVKGHRDLGDDKARRKRRAAKLQEEMEAERVPMPREKKSTAAGYTPAAPASDAGSLSPTPSFRQSNPSSSSPDPDAPLVDLPAKPLTVDSTPLHDESDWSMIRLATKQTAHAALKEASAGRLDATEMQRLYEEIQSIERSMRSMPVQVLTSTHVQPELRMEALEAETFGLEAPEMQRSVSLEDQQRQRQQQSKALVASSGATDGSSSSAPAASPFLFAGFDSFPLLLADSTRSRLAELAGSADPSYSPRSCDYSPVHAEVGSVDEIIRVLDATVQLCEAIDAPHTDSLNGYYRVLALIQGVLLQCIPLPGSSSPHSKAWFSRELTPEEQVHLVRQFWRLGRFYLSSEFSIESPAFVSSMERCVIMWTLVTLTDWALRRTPSPASSSSDGALPNPLTLVLNGVEGLCPAYALDLCNGNGVHVRDMLAACECTHPSLAHQYGELVEYWNELESSLSAAGVELRRVLPFPNSAQQQTASLSDESPSLQFVRDIANLGSYVIERRGYGGKEMSEVEATARWLFASESEFVTGQASFSGLVPQLVRDHPEFAHMRDLHFLFKLALVHTHPSIRVVLPGRYAEQHANVYWSTQGLPMSTSMVLVLARAFTKKELIQIKTRSIESAASPSLYLPASARGAGNNDSGNTGAFGGLGALMGGFGGFGGMMGLGPSLGGAAPPRGGADWNEEDVIHLSLENKIPTFGDVLTVESSERLLSLLTAPYIRTPLVMSFFANRDRVDLLADGRMQRMFAAVLFETGGWASRMHEVDIDMVPLQNTSAPSSTPAAGSSAAAASTPKARLGSPYGLLLNELTHSAGATLTPFLQLILHALELDTGHFAFDSATVRLILFVARMGVRMEGFVRGVLRLVDQGAIRCPSATNVAFLRQAHLDLLALLHGPIMSVLLVYKDQSLTVISEAVWVMSCVALVAATGVDVPAYVRELSPSPFVARVVSQCSRRFDASSASSAPSRLVELLGSFSFVLTWHSFGVGIGKDLAEEEREGEVNKPGVAGASGADLMAQFSDMIQASMAKSKLKNSKKDDPAELEKASKPPLPEVEFFQAMQRIRPAVLRWASTAESDQHQEVFDGMVEWVHGHKLGEADVEGEEGAEGTMKLRSSNPQLAAKKPALPSRTGVPSQWRPVSHGGGVAVGRFESPSQQLDIDLHSLTLTFHLHDIFPVHDLIARDADFQSVLGGSGPQHYAMTQSSQHVQSYALFGSSYTLDWWDRNLAAENVNQPTPAAAPTLTASPATSTSPTAAVSEETAESKWKCGARGCGRTNPFSTPRCALCQAYQPMLSLMEKRGVEFAGERYTRRYGSTLVADEEGWVVELLEPLLRSLFGPELDTLNYSLWMREAPHTSWDSTVTLVALDGPSFKQVVLHRSSRLCECFLLFEHARILYRSLIYSSNGRLSLGGLKGEDVPARAAPWSEVDRFAVGEWEEVQKKNMSFTLQRRRHVSPHTDVVERFVPPVLLRGLLPAVLLEHYHFYIVEGVERRDPSPDSSLSDSVVEPDLSWFAPGDMLGFIQAPFRGQVQWNFDLHLRLVESSAVTGASSLGEERKDGPSEQQLPQSSLFACHRYHALVSQVSRGSAGSMNTASLTPAPTTSVSSTPAPSASPSPAPSASPSPDPSPTLGPAHAPTESTKPFRWLLLNLQTAAPGSFLARLASVLVRVEDLSHVLVWSQATGQADAMRDRRRGGRSQLGGGALDSDDDADAFRITRVDLPRLKLSFRPRRVRQADGTYVWRLFSNDHAGFFITDTRDDALSQLLVGIPNSLLLENDKRELWLLVPNTPLKRPQVYTCPFSNELLADRSNERWMASVDTRFYIYPVHLSRSFLLSNTLASTFYLLLLALLSRQYSVCARYTETCEIDTALSAEERFVFALFEQSLHDQHPDAHAIRLKLFVCLWLSGEPMGWKSASGEPWSLEDEYSNYARKLAHVSAACRLTNEEEEVIYQQISFEESQKQETAPNELQNRAAVRGAIVKHLAAKKEAMAAVAPSASSAALLPSVDSSAASSDDPPRAPLPFKTCKRDGLTSAWWEWQKRLPSYLATDWSPGVWGGMVCYDRPGARDRRDVDLLATVGDALSDAMTGSSHKLGFLFLADLLLGGAPVHLDSSDPECVDCSWSLGRYLAQVHFLKATEMGEKIPARPTPAFLPFAVTAVFGSGFIPTPHNIQFRLPTSVPAFPPLPQVPYAGVEHQMSSGFLLHKVGTPVHSLFVLLWQWSAGFVRMASREWGERVNRPTINADMVKQGYAILQGWPSGHPSNTACKERSLRPFSSEECALDKETLASLVGRALLSVGVEEFLEETTAAASGLRDDGATAVAGDSSSSSLPFDVSHHSSAQSYVARSMLSRMSTDLDAYSKQERSKRSFQLRGIITASLLAMVRQLDASGAGESAARLQKLHAELQQLRERDWAQVQQLRATIERMANEVPGVDADASVDKPASSPASPAALRFALSRYGGQSFTLHLNFLTALLLSSTPESDVLRLNPLLRREVVPELLLHVSALLLLTNRLGLLDRLQCEVHDLRSQVRHLERKVLSTAASSAAGGSLTLARSLSGGVQLRSVDGASEAAATDEMPEHPGASQAAMAELHELAQQIAVQSSTLAENLLSARHYMSSSSSSASSSDDASATPSFSFDPRFLVFEYIFNMMLRAMQVELVRSFAGAASDRKSIVQQMIMGAGKTTVVGPLLALMLADGSSLVTMVVPSALLPMSRAVLRARFSSLVPKRIHTLEYDRATKDDPRLIAKLLYKLRQAKEKQGVVVATAVSVKSLLLKYLELLVGLQGANYDSRSLTPAEAQSLQTKSMVSDGLAQVIALWRDGILIMDEIDLLLHPLRSELNFPSGPKKPLHPAPARWEFPLHLLDAFFFHDTSHLSGGDAFRELPEAQRILQQVHEALLEGQRAHMLQMLPHLILLNGPWFHRVLKPILASWSLLWLKSRGMSTQMPDAVLLEYMTRGWANPDVSAAVTALLGPQQMVLLNLAHSWLNSFLPHVLQKINRVGYGLLKEDELASSARSTSSRLCAVPFVALDVPSRSSEFAHAEVLIGLTILAYRIEGLRVADLRHVVGTMKSALAQEMGPEHARPSARKFAEMVREGKRLRLRRMRKQRQKEGVEASSDSSLDDPSALRILPLSHFSLTDPSQLRGLFQLVRRLPRLLDYYLCSYLFPQCMNHQEFNLSASGQDLGNGMLFSCSLGFSGTPSDLLPLELGRCVYERGSDGQVLSVLTSPSVVSWSLKSPWTVRSLLRDIARSRSPRFHSLIDTGALVTGMDNGEVAAFLLEEGLEDMEGVVYLDASDNQMILLRAGGGVPIPASQSGVAPHKRFSFYDQIHTTGIDIKHSPNAVAVLTLGKDMTFRDYAQGAFRMRQIGQGQKIHLYVIPEVLKLIERELKLGAASDAADDAMVDVGGSSPFALSPSSPLFSHLPTHVAAWLTINSMRSEALQFYQLCIQNLHSVWRKKAFATLLADSLSPSPPGAMQQRRHLRFDLNAQPMHPNVLWLVECLALFQQGISFDIESGIPASKPFFATLKTMLSAHTPFIQEDAQCLAIAQVLTQALEAASTVLPQHAFDKEMVNEQEREQEQEKHQEVLKDPRAQRNEEQHQQWPLQRLRNTDPLQPTGGDGRMVSATHARNTTNLHPFFPLASFSLDGHPLPLSFPRYLLMSHCLVGTTPVVLGNGFTVPIRDVSPHTEVLSYDAAQAGHVLRPTNALLFQGHKACVELLFSDGRTVTCTPDHRFMTDDGTWVEAQHMQVGATDIKAGMEYPALLAPAAADHEWQLDLSSTLGYMLNVTDRLQHTLAFAGLLGYLLTDGSVSNSRSCLLMGHQLDVDWVVRDIRLLTNQLAGVCRERNTGIWHIGFPQPLHKALLQGGASVEERLTSTAGFPAWLTAPECPAVAVQAFLSGLFGGDGKTPALNWKGGAVRAISEMRWSCSRKGAVQAEAGARLSTDLQQLFARVGMPAASIALKSSTSQVTSVTEAGRAEIARRKAAGEQLSTSAARAVDPNKSYSLVWCIPQGCTLAFAERIGFRYTCHKQMRLTAAVAYHRLHATLERQKTALRQALLDHEEKLGRQVKRGDTANLLADAKVALAKVECVHPVIASCRPTTIRTWLMKSARLLGMGVDSAMRHFDTLRFFSEAQKNKKYNAAERRAELEEEDPEDTDSSDEDTDEEMTGDLSRGGSDDEDMAVNEAYADAYDTLGPRTPPGAIDSFAEVAAARWMGGLEAPPRECQCDWPAAASAVPSDYPMCKTCGGPQFITPTPSPEPEPASAPASASSSASASASSSRRSSVSYASAVSSSSAESSAKVVYGVPAGAQALPTFRVRLIGRRALPGTLPVYDMSVPGTENFLANSVVVHNCYYRQSWALNPKGHRRLKNIYVLLEWCPPRAGASTVSAAPDAKAEVQAAPAPQFMPAPTLTSAQADRWTRAFQLLDVDRDGKLTGSELDSLRRVLAHLLDEDAEHTLSKDLNSLTQEDLQRLMQGITKRQDPARVGGFVPAEVAASTSPHGSMSTAQPSEESDRYFVILPLSEAQTLRRSVHTAHPMFRRPTDAQFALWALDGHLLEATPFYKPARREAALDAGINPYQLNLSLQTARFVNGELYYTEEELLSLLRGFHGVHPAHRRTLMDQLLLCRHRDHRTVTRTPVEQALQLVDESHWMLLHTFRVALRAACDARGLSTLQAFHHFDLDGNGLLDADELWTACHALGLAAASSGDPAAAPASASALPASSSSAGAGVRPSDVHDFLRYADTDNQGRLNFSAWSLALRTREEAQISHLYEQQQGGDEMGLHSPAHANSTLMEDISATSSSTAPKLILMRMPPLEPPSPPPAFVPPPAAAAPTPVQAPVTPNAAWPANFPSAPAAVRPPAPVPVASQPRSPPLVVATSEWSCPVCTYNNGPGRSRCEMCDTPKQ